MTRQSRRAFLKRAAVTSAGIAASFTISGTKASGRVIGANDTVRVGVAGINGRGMAHIGAYAHMKGVQVAYLIDIDSRLFQGRTRAVEEMGKNTPKCVQDIRRALDDKDLDAISIATPNHWHSLMTIWGCQAGKDVYVEKPCSHTVFEGQKCVEAAKRYGRIVQTGTQQRSMEGRAAEIAALHAGKWGKLNVSKAYVCKPRGSIGPRTDDKAPKGVDFDLWLGPAPMQSYSRAFVPYNWHWFWDFGNGEIGNQGVHELDVARWAIPGATLPTKVWSLGGRIGLNDSGQTPNMQMAVFEFGDAILVVEVRGFVGSKGYSPKVGNEFYTSEGRVGDRGFSGEMGNGYEFQPKQGGKAHDVKIEPIHVTPGGPFGSFIQCVRSRKPEAINAPILEGHYSAALCHLANISYRLGTESPWSRKPEGLDNPQVAESFETIKANLKAFGVDLDKTNYRMGRTLVLDPKTEQFVGDDEANKLLTQEYRKPFVVPDEV